MPPQAMPRKCWACKTALVLSSRASLPISSPSPGTRWLNYRVGACSVCVAYPDSADAYLADGQKDLARQYAEKALTPLDSHKAPLSSWSDTEERREEIRRAIESTLARATKGAEH